MDERLQSILDSVQRTATTAANTAGGAAYSVGKKANQLLSAGKLNVRIAELKAEVAHQLEIVGEMVYATHTGDPTSSDELLEKLREIDALNAQIDAMAAKVAQTAGVDPEDALHRACDKFARRFRLVEEGTGRPLTDYTQEELIALWKRAKEQENKS